MCNGLDDDCDGKTDEQQMYQGAFFDVGDLCDTALGICRRPGTIACDPDGGGGVICNGPRGEPLEAEVCNGEDDDCDGAIDEGNPGGGAACVDERKVGRCTAGVEQCVDGTVVCRSNVDPIPERCNRADDDCDGLLDEVARLNEACQSNGIGQCQRTGRYVCRVPSEEDNNGQLICNAENGDPAEELCNGEDDDSDGIEDEGNPEGGAACNDETKMAVVELALRPARQAMLCVVKHKERLEVCNRVDDDCDGLLDEVATVATMHQRPGEWGEMDSSRAAFRVLMSKMPCAMMEISVQCDTGPAGHEICDGLDNNCNGINDEGFNVTKCVLARVNAADRGCSSARWRTDTVCEGNLGDQEVELCMGETTL